MNELLARLNVDDLMTRLVAWLPSLGAAIVIFVLFWIAFRLTRGPLRSLLASAGLDRALVRMLVNVYRAIVLVFGGVMAASQLGIDVGAALAGLGVVGLTIGFAAKDSLSNTIAGFLIFWDKPFRVDDWITVDDQYGKVTEITMRTTRIRTPKNTYVIIPNQTVIDEVLVNHSKHGETRVDVPVGIAYKEDILEARRVLLEAASSVKDVIDEPPPDVVVTSLGDSSVNLDVRVWIRDTARERPVFFQTIESCKTALDKAGIEIPFPHLQFIFDQISDGVLEKTSKHLRADSKAA